MRILKSTTSRMKNINKNVKRDFQVIISQKFYDNIKHLLFINRLIGLFPIAVTEKNGHYTLEWSWLKVIITNVFVFLYATLTLIGLTLSYHVDVVYNVRLKGLSALMCTLAEIITLVSTWIIGQVYASFTFKEFWQYLIFLTKFDEVIGPLPPSKKIIVVVLMAYTFTFTCLGMDVYMWAQIVVPEIGAFQFIWQLVPFYFTYVFTVTMEVNIWITIHGITARARKLNNLILHISYEDDSVFIVKFPTGPRKNLLQSNMLTSSMLRKFIAAYDSLAEANRALVKFYGLSMIIMLGNVIVCLVITPYVLYQQILNAKDENFLFTQTYWMICHVLRLLFLVEPCHSGYTMGREIRKTVTKLLSLDLPKVAYKQAKILLMVINENKIEFSAAGLALIDRSLLPIIGSAVFTYLTILFQYKNNS
ncbi:gustatory receptor for sugar taste 43a [Euwallacea fornicatus]|uniref:gustatory receptor for sugar taste 43a n=1 Tax=Euwallacea fornicatus TaxID=995702 RepID=UPI00338F3B31